MAAKKSRSAGHLAEAGRYVLVGSYAGSPCDWWIAQVVYADDADDEVCIRRTDLTGTERYLQVLDRQSIRAVAAPTAMEAAAEGGVLAAAVRALCAFRRKAEEAWGRGDQTITQAEQALMAAREAKWAALDSLFQTGAGGDV